MTCHILTQEDRLAGNKARWADYTKLQLTCAVCGKIFSRPPSTIAKGKGKYCSQSCANGQPRSQPIQIKYSGYVYLKDYEHPYRQKGNLIAEHRVVIERQLDRFLTKVEIPHHIDEDKQNNTLSNLYLCRNRLEHKVAHQLRVDDLRMLTLARWEEWEAFKNFNLLKGIQDQLQAMVPLKMSASWVFLDAFIGDYMQTIDESYDFPDWDSWEQLWLAFVMFELYHKVWSNGEWVNA